RDNDAGGNIPFLQVALPETVIASGRDIGEIERGGPEAADARGEAHDPLQLFQEAVVIGLAKEGNAGRKKALRHAGAARNAQAPVVHIGAAALLDRKSTRLN